MFRQYDCNLGAPPPLILVTGRVQGFAWRRIGFRTRGRAIERSAVRERPIRPRTPDAPFASQSVDNKTTAERWWPGAGVFGYALHGLALLLFALWAAWHFGQVFSFSRSSAPRLA